MVNTNTLAQLAEELDLGSYLYLGKGIAKGGGRNLKSLLANGFEAVLGAVFLDAGYDAAYHYYLDRYRSLSSFTHDVNYKGRLQQVAQERFGATPFYDSEGAKVGAHREYTSVVFAGAEPLGTGHGASKQEAEQDAARVALESLGAAAAEAPPVKTPKPRARRSPRRTVEPKTEEAPATASEVADAQPVSPIAESGGPEPAAQPGPEASDPGPVPGGAPSDKPVSQPVLELVAEPAPEALKPRSRQFGEPID